MLHNSHFETSLGLEADRSNIYQPNLRTGCLFLPSILGGRLCTPTHREGNIIVFLHTDTLTKHYKNDINSMLKCSHTWDFLSWQWIITLCSRKKTICLQVVGKTFREPLIKVFREPWMATYSREDFWLASSARLISLGVCLKLCRPHFSYFSKCHAFKKCKMIVPKSAFHLKPHATIPQLYLLPSTCITCHFKLWIVEASDDEHWWRVFPRLRLGLRWFSCFIQSLLDPWGFFPTQQNSAK